MNRGEEMVVYQAGRGSAMFISDATRFFVLTENKQFRFVEFEV